MANSFEPTPEMLALLEQARQGSRDAAAQLFEAWKRPVLMDVREQLGWPLRRLFDSDDFLQEVAVELSSHDIAPEVFESAERFMAYVTGLAVNKVSEERRRYATLKRALSRDIALAVRERVRLLKRAHASALAPDHEERVDQEDELARLERGLPPVHRAIVRLRLAGWTYAAIAKRFDINERTVRRVWQKVIDSAPPQRMSRQ